MAKTKYLLAVAGLEKMIADSKAGGFENVILYVDQGDSKCSGIVGKKPDGTHKFTDLGGLFHGKKKPEVVQSAVPVAGGITPEIMAMMSAFVAQMQGAKPTGQAPF